jgi:hypothetical protein
MAQPEFYYSLSFFMLALLGWPDVGPNDPLGPYINNVYFATLATILVITAGAYPEEAFSLRYSPFMLVPAIHLLANFYYKNTSARAAAKAKK